MPERSSDVIEIHAEKAFAFGLGGLLSLSLAALLYHYRGDGMLVGLALVLACFGAYAVVRSIYWATQIRKVTRVEVDCPYCQHKNMLTEAPEKDFTCLECKRLIPIIDGRILSVSQVKCNYCGEQNYYSDKTILLICEKCDHEIPIAREDGGPKRQMPKGFVVDDDTRTYELILVAHGNETDDLVRALQQMLALNRNQVKQMLTELPVTLLRGITRRKAEMLQAQLTAHHGVCEFRAIDG